MNWSADLIARDAGTRRPPIRGNASALHVSKIRAKKMPDSFPQKACQALEPIFGFIQIRGICTASMKEKLKNKLASGTAILLLAAIILGILFVLSLFGGSIMKLFGFQYTSLGSLFLYFFIIFILGFPVEVFASAFPRALVSLGWISRKVALIFYLVLDTLCSCIVMAAVDALMDSVSATDLSIFAVSFLFSLLDLKDYKKKLSDQNQDSGQQP